MSRDGIKLTREELYARVWSKPATELAREFGSSDVALAKICRKMNVRVSSKIMRRALLLMDALLKALETRGYSIEVGTADRQLTTILAGQEKVRVHLDDE